MYFDASRCHTVVRTSGSYIHDEFVKQHILLAENGALHLVTQLRETLTPQTNIKHINVVRYINSHERYSQGTNPNAKVQLTHAKDV